MTKSNPIKSSADKSVLEVGEEQSKRKSSDPGGGISTANPIYEYSEEINAQAERDFNERRDNLWKVCQKRQIIGKMSPNAWEFFLSPGHGLAWCTVYKAASSAWMYYFNILGGYFKKTNIRPSCLKANYSFLYFQPAMILNICNVL